MTLNQTPSFTQEATGPTSPRAGVQVGDDGPLGGDVDVAVIGGGITGSATAYYLSRAGARVVMLDRHDVGSEGSGRNAGSLHGQIQHQPFVQWGEEWARDFLPALSFLADSLQMWAGLSGELGVDLEVKTRGGLLLADNGRQLRLIERKVGFERAAGIDSRMLDQSELRDLAPYVSPKILGAEYCPIEGKANPMLAAPAFARMAVAAGARVVTRANVVGFETTRGKIRVVTNHGSLRATRVVLASGDGLAQHAQMLGWTLPITTEPVQVSVTEPLMPLIDHLVYFAGKRLTLKQSRSGGVLIGGGWPARLHDVSKYPLVNMESFRDNLDVALHAVPALGQALIVRSWAGIGNGTPDLRPILGALPDDPRFLVGIFPHMGLTAGPLMGRILAELALEYGSNIDLEPFRVDRFLLE
jgi:glycine/D-amino acid oxidase-like deaminating enzyme